MIHYEDPNNPQAQYKRIQINPPKASALINRGTLYNDGSIMPATVKLNDNLSLGALSVPGKYPELFNLMNYGTIVNNGTIYTRTDLGMITLLATVTLEDGTVICFYSDWTFQMFFPDGGKLTGNYTFYQQMLVFVLNDGVVVEPPEGTATVGDPSYSFPASSGRAVDFTLSADFVADLYGKMKT